MRPQSALIITSILLVVAAPAFAQTCFIGGHITAGPNTELPSMGAWCYELTVTWDTDVQQAVSHINLIVDDGTNCVSEDFTSAIIWPTMCGTSSGVPAPCEVPYYVEFNFGGDPSLDIDDPLYKFEPDEELGCAPGTVGEAVFVFYSDYAPVPTDLPNLLIVDKFGRASCAGELTGVFPGLPCGPVPAVIESWGSVKTIFDR